MSTNYVKCLVFILVILILINMCDCKKKDVKTKKRKVDRSGVMYKNPLTHGRHKNVTSKEQARGFFGSGLFPFGKVIKLFTAPGDDDGRECQPSGHAVARAGVCLNAYECHDRQGRASGECAKGLGVCCVFEVSCGNTVQNNLTYFMSPGFPDLWNGEEDCDITIHKVTEGIMQLRVDFVHFTIGQPNRTTGECDEDAMILGEGANNFTVCGQNHGQHLYYTLTNEREKRDTEELAGARGTRLRIRIRGSEMPRIWLLRLAQMPLAHSAPHDCLQWYRENNGTIKTFNYAVNGRHLSGHDYRACIRHNVGYCSVRYTPCDSRSFRIGSGGDQVQNTDP
ncbi:uncharacterized protein LOC116412923, partial [Galleria mellonella]|uniref:Uncharacterized protein LOC116412923 n=1 Tax=Galleria mellonella TaxID=7137 RepID=A0ABM3MJD6_GALME